MPKLLGGSPAQPMKPDKMTKEVTFYNGETVKMPRNWQAVLTGGYPGDENMLVMKKFPPKTKLHPNPLSDEEKLKSLQEGYQVKVPVVVAQYYTSSDAGQAYYNIMSSITGSYPRHAHDYGDTIIKSKGEIRGKDIPGAVKCSVQAMNFFSMNSPRTLNNELVLSRASDELKSCLVSEQSSAKFDVMLPERWKK